MAYYLSMDGVDDYVSIPSMAFDEIIMDFSAEQIAATEPYFDGTGTTTIIRRLSGGTDSYGGMFNAVYINGSVVTSGTAFVPSNTRVTMRATVGAASTTEATAWFANTTASGFMKGKLYDVKYLLDGVVVAHYDMTLGNVLDQSGNGRDATLTGGTWVSDATGTDATVTGIAATATNSAVSPSISGAGSITATAATSTISGIAPSVSTQAVITSVAASVTAQALAPSIGSPALVNAVVSSATAAGLGPTVVAIRNVEIMGSIAAALAVAVVPRIQKAGWSSIASTPTTWSSITSNSTTWRESTVAPTIWR